MKIKYILPLVWCLLLSCAVIGCTTSEQPLRQGQLSRHLEKESLNQEESINEERSVKVLRHSLDSYLKQTALRNPGLRSVFSRWKAALERIPQAKSLPDPKFNYSYYISEVETRVGPQNHRMGVAQVFPWFGTLELRNDKASEEAKIARTQFESKKVGLFFQVKAAYYEYYYLRRAIEITQRNIDLLKSLESVAQAKVRTGSGVGGVMQAQLEIGKLEDQLKTLNDMREPFVGKLNAAIGWDLATDLPFPDTIGLTEFSIDSEKLSRLIDLTNPELQGLKHQVEVNGIDIALAKKQFYPEVQLGVDYIATGKASNPGISDSGKDPIMAMFSVNIPLWYGKRRAALSEARDHYDASLDFLKDFDNRLKAELKMAVFEFNDAERKLSLYQHTLKPLAENSLNVAQESYERGGADFLELIDSQRLLLEFQLSHERASTDRETAIANIERLIGQEIPRTLFKETKNQP
ncbi:TolC family protein [bacterium]|nr:TolC family protein [bacterium]